MALALLLASASPAPALASSTLAAVPVAAVTPAATALHRGESSLSLLAAEPGASFSALHSNEAAPPSPTARRHPATLAQTRNAAEPGGPPAGTLLAEAATGAVAVVDDQGTEIRLAAPAQRIIALYGAFNEILAAMGLADRLAARTQADAEPPEIAALPSIGTHMRPNLELILGLAPDLALQMGGREAAGEPVAALRRLGVPTAFFTAGSFAELFAVIERLGALTGEPARAAALIAALTARLDKVEENVKAARARGATAPRVVYEARYPNLLAAGRLSLVNEVIARAGGLNAVENDGKLVRLAEEELLRLNPDVYLVQRGPMNPAPIPPAERPHFASLAAVQAGRVHDLDERAFSRPGPRAVAAVEELARILYPDAGW